MTITTDAEPAPPLLAVRGKPVRLPWNRRVWAAVTLLFAGLALLGQFVIVPSTTPALRMGAAYAWAYPQDRASEVVTSAAGASQSTVPIRSGQRQGILFTVYNPSDHAQRVLGLRSGAWPSSFADARVEVATASSDPRYAGVPDAETFGSGVSIPPHRERWVRLSWVSMTCFDAGPGATMGIDTVSLRVRVGLITRGETITLPQEFAFSGPSAPGTCPP